MQNLTLEGYLAADPTILSAQGSGRKRASFRVLETTHFRKADGSPGERTTGFNCLCFNATTTENYIEAFARKGSRVVIHGHVENDTWTGKDGVEHYDLRVIVGDLRLKNRRSDSSAPKADSPSRMNAADTSDLSDEIPI